MSLEAKIDGLTVAINELITVIRSGPAVLEGEPAAGKRTRRTKEQMEADKAAADAQNSNPRAVVFGDPEGTTYFHIEKHKSVAARKPGDPEISIEGAVQIDAPTYITLKEQYAKNAQTAATTSSTKPAESPAAGAPAFTDVVAKLKEVDSKVSREALHGLLKQFGAAAVPKLAELGKNAEIIAAADALLVPKAEEDPFAS